MGSGKLSPVFCHLATERPRGRALDLQRAKHGFGEGTQTQKPPQSDQRDNRQNGHGKPAKGNNRELHDIPPQGV